MNLDKYYNAKKHEIATMIRRMQQHCATGHFAACTISQTYHVPMIIGFNYWLNQNLYLIHKYSLSTHVTILKIFAQL